MWFRQEFLAEFLSNVLGAFRKPVDSDHEYVTFGQLADIARKQALYIGVDFARTTDWTVIAVMDATGKVIYRERFQLKPWPYVVERCRAVWQACNRAQMAIDRTGLGDVVYAMLLQAGIDPGRLIPFVFTSDTKAELVITGQKLNEEGKLRVPARDTSGCQEFDAYEVHTNDNGKFKFGAPEGKHDDFVTAVLLAAWLMVGSKKFDIGHFKFYEPAVA